jgi:hypothetical protein
MLRPQTVTVIIHGTIETKGMKKEDVPALRDRVRAMIEPPIEARLNGVKPS